MIFEEQEEEDPSLKLPDINTPLDLRPDLSEYGLVEHERGVVEDTFENRATLRQANLNWDYVYDQLGNPTGLIAARSKEALKERRLMSLAEKRALLTDPTKNNSDFLTGVDLLVDDSACRVTPPWVVAATRKWVKEQDNGLPSPTRRPSSLPHRCRIVKSDGIRCMLWSSGRPSDDGQCRIHLQNNSRKSGADVERARHKILQSAPHAVDVIEELMQDAQSEPVRLKAATEILDRAGVRGGIEIGVDVDVSMRSPAEIVAERLQRLAQGAVQIAASLPDTQVTDADVVIEDSTNGGTINNE